MERFETKLWDLVASYDSLSQSHPRLLVDCLKVVEVQEAMDR